MDLLVRAARPDDAEPILEILNPIIETGIYTALDTPYTVAEERAYIQDFPQRGVFLVAVRRQDRKIVGLQSVEPFAAYTHAFDHVGVIGAFVDLSLRRQGIGSCLFRATFEAAVEKGYEKFFTFIRADNLAAIAAYLNQGFRIIGAAQQQAKINGQYVDEVLVEKLF